MTNLSEFWSDVSIAGHRCRAFEPSVPSLHGYAVLYLHDADEIDVAANHALSSLLEKHGLRCLAPLTGRSWWTDRVWPLFDAEQSTERFVLEPVLNWLREQWDVRPPLVALLGVGMGGQGALKLSYKHPNVFPICAAIAPTIDYHYALEAGDQTLNALYRDAEQARQDTATLHIHPLNWPRHQWFCSDTADYLSHDGADRLRMKLYSLGVPYEADLEATADGDQVCYAERMLEPAMAFIVDRLERERLRV
ncbi:alpha/beta hydrolase-fold protein [Lacipirellula sp.]|uniref:alpha/beta hydrolase-fold protein n=1 Tax=Lacipirellula sp. TaxID=2691419 RepID=UPI003D13842E